MKKEATKFNRLVLVGNGFDLALGLNTGYNDFVLWLLKKYFFLTLNNSEVVTRDRRSFNGGYLNNDTFEIGIRQNYSNVSYEVEISKIESIKDIKHLWERYDIEYKIKSKFLNLIIKHSDDLGWVDIESLFYLELKNCINNKQEDINRLNHELDFLSKELELHLYEVDDLPDGWQKFGATVCSQLSREIGKDELEDESLLSEDKLPDILYFLNFNYTKSLFNLTRDIRTWNHLKEINPEWNPIHGQIRNKNAPIVFGFGDESDKDYQRIENLNKNTFFEHIKSFKYSQTKNYQHLIKFLDSANFQVFIYGHSCGLSDRTMLKEIFEHKNCKSIKIFYYKRPDGSDDFLEKTMEISRHFSDKALMRRKVVNKELCHPIPQNYF
ncbi:Bacteriophage abortive infection AbiH [Salegentibacter agarivorans]|uniref:Bacteriophage abortive infection AbiH n=1 Tax=Salegentibacter agarivorans TaxID=345907 RepID=A0A1I2NJG3_9FLAO|nr:AbiH family protein [Salegentibacter agarivorans]SFG03768.1 Bacteriophage abortive infection AbiH [Salegentibacter agarivorans]